MWHRRYFGFGFGSGFPHRGSRYYGMRPFPRRKEYLAMLEEYKKSLEEELKEVESEIQELKQNWNGKRWRYVVKTRVAILERSPCSADQKNSGLLSVSICIAANWPSPRLVAGHWVVWWCHCHNHRHIPPVVVYTELPEKSAWDRANPRGKQNSRRRIPDYKVNTNANPNRNSDYWITKKK